MSSDDEVERIAHVPRRDLDDRGWLTHGYRADPDRTIHRQLEQSLQFAPRPDLETDPSRQQIIPYVVVRADGRIWTMRRRRAQTERRLHDQLSIGVGGHVPDDVLSAAGAPLPAGMRRELHEELHIPEEVEVTYTGLLNDDTNEVGRVHLGLVYTCEAPREAVAIRETDKLVGEWKTLGELREREDRLETWSQLLLPELEGE